MSLIFNYKTEKFDGEQRKLPKIPIKIMNNDNYYEFAALVDSGSDAIYIPYEISKYIPYEISKLLDLKSLGKKEDVETIGQRITLYPSKIDALVIHKGNRRYRFNYLPVLFPKSKKYDCPDLILGRVFFELFDITFKQNANKIILKRSNKK